AVGAFKQFFAKEKDINAGNYPVLNNAPGNRPNLVINGGFTKEAVLYELVPSMTAPDDDQIKKIMTDVFGPLWILVQQNRHHVFSGNYVNEHPIMTALLVRY